jgi:hypothetical protein
VQAFVTGVSALSTGYPRPRTDKAPACCLVYVVCCMSCVPPPLASLGPSSGNEREMCAPGARRDAPEMTRSLARAAEIGGPTRDLRASGVHLCTSQVIGTAREQMRIAEA